MSEKYTDVCVLRRCGQVDGNEICCERIMRSMERNIVLNSIWNNIIYSKCSCYIDGVCITREYCEQNQSFCYPLVLDKKINKTVAVMFAYYCVDRAENYASSSYAASAAASAASAAANAASAAASAASAADGAYAASAADDDNDVDKFFFKASKELEKLINAWGTPIERKPEPINEAEWHWNEELQKWGC